MPHPTKPSRNGGETKGREKSAAILTINAPGRMTARGRKDIAAWLRKHASDLLKHGDEYTEGRFTGRFIYS